MQVHADSQLHNDPIAMRRVFASKRRASLWVLPRTYVGWVWMSVGWAMLQSPAWMRDGSSLAGAWAPGSTNLGPDGTQAAAGLNLTSPILEAGLLVWVARFTALGLTITGIAVILGIATGFAAFAGVVLSVSVLTTGAMAPGPEVFALAMMLVLAWKTAGWIGFDRWLLPLAGAPWGNAITLRPPNISGQAAD